MGTGVQRKCRECGMWFDMFPNEQDLRRHEGCAYVPGAPEITAQDNAPSMRVLTKGYLPNPGRQSKGAPHSRPKWAAKESKAKRKQPKGTGASSVAAQLGMGGSNWPRITAPTVHVVSGGLPTLGKR